MSDESLFARRPDDHRSSARLPCSAAISARLVHAPGVTKVSPGEVFELRSLNVSKGGALLRTPWPLSVSDRLVLLLKQATGAVLEKPAEVVSARRAADGGFLSGVRFLSQAEVSAPHSPTPASDSGTPSSTRAPSPPPRSAAA